MGFSGDFEIAILIFSCSILILQEEVEPSPEVHFEPVVKLEEQDVQTGEENEDTLFKMRAKLFRYDKPTKEWKERGTGDVKFLQHKDTKNVRLVMRRDKTFKVCANHLVTPGVPLTPNIGSDRSWVWTVATDVSEGTPEQQTLAIRFSNSENAKAFKAKYEECQLINTGEGVEAENENVEAENEDADDEIDSEDDGNDNATATATATATTTTPVKRCKRSLTATCSPKPSRFL